LHWWRGKELWVTKLFVFHNRIFPPFDSAMLQQEHNLEATRSEVETEADIGFFPHVVKVVKNSASTAGAQEFPRIVSERQDMGRSGGGARVTCVD
jgi:hypothetical protein